MTTGRIKTPTPIGALCCGSILLILAVVGILIARAVTYPSFPDFTVDTISISTDTNNLTSAFALHVTAYNPSTHYWAYYDVVFVSVYGANHTLLAYQVLPDPMISHHPKTWLSLNASPVAENVSTVAASGSVEVRVRAATRFKRKAWNKWSGVLKIVCSQVAIEFNSSDASWAGRARAPSPCYIIDYGFDF